METFSHGSVVKVPFPCTDLATRQYRPVLVVSSAQMADAHGLLWVLMITSAAHRGWAGDVTIKNVTDAGLPAPSVIRTAKIATIDAADATRLGSISASLLKQVRVHVGRELGLPAEG